MASLPHSSSRVDPRGQKLVGGVLGFSGFLVLSVILDTLLQRRLPMVALVIRAKGVGLLVLFFNLFPVDDGQSGPSVCGRGVHSTCP